MYFYQTEAECVPYNENIQNFTCICNGEYVIPTNQTKSDTNNDDSEGQFVEKL